MPKGRGDKCGHAGTEARLLALGRDSQVHVIAEPEIRVDVPVAQICVRVLGQLNAEGLDILKAIPVHSAGLGVNALVADTGEDASAFRQVPNAVVLHASSESNHM